MSSEPQRDSIPFEPNRKRKKKANKVAQAGKSKTSVSPNPVQNSPSTAVQSTPIPEVVSRRMLRRMIVFSGLPTGLAIAIFFGSYLLLTRNIIDFPKYLVLFATLGCFGLGVVGLSYGALSASWDEDRDGGWFGLREFRTNFGRLTEAWRTNSPRV